MVQLVQISLEEFSKIVRDVVSEELSRTTSLKTSKPLKAEKEFLTREETKNLLNISYTTLWKLNNESVLSTRKIGRKVFYFRQDVLDLLSKGEGSTD